MRKWVVYLVVILLCSSLEGQAQNWNEWVRQKRTQIRYLVKQIAGLQVYIELGQEGYGIVKDGLGLINDIKQGDFDLHKGYFTSLSTVRTGIRHSGRAKEAKVLYYDIRRQVNLCKKFAGDQSAFGDASGEFINATLDRFLRSAEQNFFELQMLVSDGNYTMKDDERLRRIDGLYAELVKQYGFIKTFFNDLVGIVMGKDKEIKDAERLGRLHGGKER